MMHTLHQLQYMEQCIKATKWPQLKTVIMFLISFIGYPLLHIIWQPTIAAVAAHSRPSVNREIVMLRLYQVSLLHGLTLLMYLMITSFLLGKLIGHQKRQQFRQWTLAKKKLLRCMWVLKMVIPRVEQLTMWKAWLVLILIRIQVK